VGLAVLHICFIVNDVANFIIERKDRRIQKGELSSVIHDLELILGRPENGELFAGGVFCVILILNCLSFYLLHISVLVLFLVEFEEVDFPQ
jgi:hypothetical protein